jgi:pimeloyl-ACP methyl ester carboxylesterase
MNEQFLPHAPAPGADRLPFHVEEYGGGDAICILLHGFGEGAYVWRDLAPSLPKKYRSIIVDFRGHGNSREDPTANYSIETYCDDILSLIESKNSNGISIIGHSLGAGVAVRVAASAPHIVSNLILVDWPLSTTWTAHDNIFSQFHEQCDGYNSLAEYAAWILDRRPLTHPRMLRHIVGNALRETAEGKFVLKADRRVTKIFDKISTSTNKAQDLLRRIICRTLLVRGKGSAILSKMEALSIVGMLKDGHLCEISGAGHAVMADDPDQFADAVNQFLLGSRI